MMYEILIICCTQNQLLSIFKIQINREQPNMALINETLQQFLALVNELSGMRSQKYPCM